MLPANESLLDRVVTVTDSLLLFSGDFDDGWLLGDDAAGVVWETERIEAELLGNDLGLSSGGSHRGVNIYAAVLMI